MKVSQQLIFCILVKCIQKASTAPISPSNRPFDLRPPDFYAERSRKLSQPLVFPTVPEDAQVLNHLRVKRGQAVNHYVEGEVFYGTHVDTGASVLIHYIGGPHGVRNVESLWMSFPAYMFKPLLYSFDAGYVIYDLPEGHFLSDLLLRKAPNSSTRSNIIQQVINILYDLHKYNFFLGDIRAENIFITAEGQVKFLKFTGNNYDIDTWGLVSLNMSLLGVQVNQGIFFWDLSRLDKSVASLVSTHKTKVSADMWKKINFHDFSYVKTFYKDCLEGKTSITQYFLVDPVAYYVYLAKHLSMADMSEDLNRPKSFIVEEEGEYLSVLLRQENSKSPFSSAIHLVEAIAAPIYYLHRQGLCHGDINANTVFVAFSAIYLTSDGNHLKLDDSCGDIRNMGLLLREYMDSPLAENLQHLPDENTQNIVSISQKAGTTIDDILYLLDLKTWTNTMYNMNGEFNARWKDLNILPPAFISILADDSGKHYVLKKKSLEGMVECSVLKMLPLHHNVMGFYGIDPETRAIKVEYINGIDVGDVLGYGSPNLPTMIAFSKQLTNGLNHLHSFGFCHNDLHRGNMRLSYDGVVKIIDFDRTKKFEEIPITLRCDDMAHFANTILAFQGRLDSVFDPAFVSYINSLDFPILKKIINDALLRKDASILKNSSLFDHMDDQLSKDLVKHYAKNAATYGIYEMYTMPIQSDQRSSIFAIYPSKMHVPILRIEGSEIVRVRGNYLSRLIFRNQIPLIPEISKFIIDLLSLIKTMQSRQVCHRSISDKVIFVRSNKTRDIILMRFDLGFATDMETCTDLENSKAIIGRLVNDLPFTNESMKDFVNIMSETSDINTLLQHASTMDASPRNVYKCEGILNKISNELKENPIDVLENYAQTFKDCLSKENLSKDEVIIYQDLLMQIGDQYFEDPRNMAGEEFTAENSEFSRLLLDYQNAVSKSD